MKFVKVGFVISLCVLLSVQGERSAKKRDWGRLQMKRCNCDSVMIKMTQMIDKKLHTLERKIVKELSEIDTGPHQARTKFKIMGHRLGKLGGEVHGAKALIEKQAAVLQHTGTFLYNERDDAKTLEEKYSALASTVQNLTAIVDNLERVITRNGPELTTTSTQEPEEFPKALAAATLNYNFQDVLAQSTCTAVVPNTYSRVWAMRRECSHVGKYTCNDICNRKGMTCFEALHVYKGPVALGPNPLTAQPNEGVPGLSMFRYFEQGCTWRAGHCGPNYCCCRGPWRLQPTNIVL